MHRKIINLALPSIVSNITVPLLGLVDTAITGHMGEARYIGAIAVGSMIFNIMYWLFAFLRMGTGGMTAQAYGRKDFGEADLTGLRAISISSLIGRPPFLRREQSQTISGVSRCALWSILTRLNISRGAPSAIT